MVLYSCEQVPVISTREDPIVVDVQPFAAMPAAEVDNVVKRLKAVYPHIRLLHSIPLPAEAYNAVRGRYRADSIIRFLSGQTTAPHVTLGITGKDISTTKNNISDWGVMGLGYHPGNACVVSTFRLNKARLSEQLYKVCIHEIGHTQGLAHCPVDTCFMRDAEGHNPTDEEIAFCANCKRQLVAKGWRFN